MILACCMIIWNNYERTFMHTRTWSMNIKWLNELIIHSFTYEFKGLTWSNHGGKNICMTARGRITQIVVDSFIYLFIYYLFNIQSFMYLFIYLFNYLFNAQHIHVWKNLLFIYLFIKSIFGNW